MARRIADAYRPVLAPPGMLRSYLTAILARLPNGFHTLAVLLLIRESSGSYTVAGAAVAATFGVMMLAAAPVGRLVDRRGQTRVLLVTAMWAASAMVALAVAATSGAPTAALITLAAMSGITPPVSACQRAIVSDHFTDEATRRSAFALESILQETIWIGGPLIGTVALIVSGPAAMLVVAAALLAVGTTVFATGPRSRSWRPHPGRVHGRSALAHPGLRTMIGLGFLAAVSFGIFEVAVPAFSEEHDAKRAAGVILALWASGSLIGGLLYGLHHAPTSARRRLAVTSAACAIGFLPAAFASNIWWLGALVILAGLGIAPLLSVIYGTTGDVAPPGTVTEAFAWLNVAFPAGFTLGAPIAGAIADGPGAAVAMAAAVAPIACGLLWLSARGGTLASAPTPDGSTL